MSITAMNWALQQRLASPLQQILLYVIADSADPDGLTRYCDPTYMECHARLTRSTMFRMLGELQALALLERRKYYSERGDVRYEIALNLTTLIDVPVRRRRKPDDPSNGGEDYNSPQDEEMNETPESHPETLLENDQSPAGAQAKSQSCDYHIDDPSLPKKDSPPYPPPGGLRSREERQQEEKRDLLWERFKQGYPSIARMDQAVAREELDKLSFDDAEWAIGVLPELRAELAKPKAPPPRGAHLWLRKGMFRNFVRGKTDAPPPEGTWVAEGSPEDRALAVVRPLAGALAPFVLTQPDGARGYLTMARLGPDLLAMLEVAGQSPLRWLELAQGTPQWTAWQQRFMAWTGRQLGARLGDGVIRVPWPWPPARDGRIYDEPPPPLASEPHDETEDIPCR